MSFVNLACAHIFSNGRSPLHHVAPARLLLPYFSAVAHAAHLVNTWTRLLVVCRGQRSRTRSSATDWSCGEPSGWRAAAKARARDWQLPVRVRNTAVIIYDLAGFRTEPAARFLAAAGRQRQWSRKPDIALQAFVGDTFLELMTSAGAPVVAALVNAASPSDAPAMRAAQRWVEEWGLFCWAERQNTERGVAPDTRALLARPTATRAAAGRAPPGTTALSKVRKWATNFRRRWGGRFGSIPAKECAPLGEMMEKAFASRRSERLVGVSHLLCSEVVRCRLRNAALFLGIKNGTKLGTAFFDTRRSIPFDSYGEIWYGAVFVSEKRHRFRVRKTDPDLVPFPEACVL